MSIRPIIPKVLIAISVLLCYNNVFALNYSDSLKTLTESKYHDTIKVQLLFNLMETASDNDNPSGFEIGSKIIELAQELERTDIESRVYSAFANHYRKKGVKDSVLYYTNKANTIYESLEDYKSLAESYRKLAIFYIHLDKPDSCLVFFEQGFRAAEMSNDSLTMAKILIQKASFLGNTGFYQRAINTISKALAMPQLLKDSSACSLAYSSLALIHFNMDNIQEGIYNTKKSLRFSKNTTTSNYAIGLVNLGGLYCTIGDTNMAYADSSIHYSLEALKYDKYLISHTKKIVYNNLANMYMTKEEYPEALKYITLLKQSIDNNESQDMIAVGYYASVSSRYYSEMGDYNQAISILKKYKEEVLAAFSTEYYKFLSGYYFENNQFKDAYIMLEEYDRLEDSIKGGVDYQQLYLKEAEYNFDMKEQALITQQEILEAKQNRRKILIIALIGFLVLLGIIILLVTKEYYRKEKDNKLLQKQKSEIEEKEHIATMLLGELNHRVKNNLQMVSSLLAMQNYKSTKPEVNYALSMARLRIDTISLLHQHLYKAANNIDPNLNEYVTELVKHVVDSSAHNDKIKLKLNIVDYSVKINTAIHIGLIVNELVTNAIKHGVNPDINNNSLEVNIIEKGDRLNIEAIDSGNIKKASDTEKPNFGFKLVKLLASEYNGNIESSFNGNGKVSVSLCIHNNNN